MDKYDLISRSALLKNGTRIMGNIRLPDGRTIRVEGISVPEIEYAPAVDPEELKGRCRTCRYSLPISEDRNYPHIFCDQHDVYMTQDDFCSRYEARGE